MTKNNKGRDRWHGDATPKQTADRNHTETDTIHAQVPKDSRVLRLILALSDVGVPDRNGAEPIQSYDLALEVLQALRFLYNADAGMVKRACIAAMAECGDLPPPAEVVRFSRDKGGAR